MSEKIAWMWRKVGVKPGMTEAERDQALVRLQWMAKGVWYGTLWVWLAIGISIGASYIWDRLWAGFPSPILWDVLGGVFIITFVGFLFQRDWWLRGQKKGIDAFVKQE